MHGAGAFAVYNTMQADDDRTWETLSVGDKVKAKGASCTYRKGTVVEIGQTGHRIIIRFDGQSAQSQQQGLENLPRSQVIKLVPRIGSAGLDEVGETNSPTVGKNFMQALEKGYQHTFGAKGFTDLKHGLHRQGIDPSSIHDAPPLKSLMTQQHKESIWTQCAQMYTSELLYRALNRSCREDSPALLDFADFIGVLIFGGHSSHAHVCSFAPQCTRLATALTVYRGFSLDPDLAARYPEGKTFYWQSFVSTSRSAPTATAFAHANATSTTAPFVFHIEVPEYNAFGMRAFDLSQVSTFQSENEILLLPYTRFCVKTAPFMDADGTYRVELKVLSVPLSQELKNITVLVDQNGYTSGDNAALARHAFERGLPGAAGPDGDIRFSLDALAAFNCPATAVQFMVDSLRQLSAIHFKILVSGKNAEALLGAYQEQCADSPCQVMVFCLATDYWREKLTNHRVTVTNSLAKATAFVEHCVFDDTAGDQGGAGAFVPLLAYLKQHHHIQQDTNLAFWWKQGCGGDAVQYGHGAHGKAMFRQVAAQRAAAIAGGGVSLPGLPMANQEADKQGLSGKACFMDATATTAALPPGSSGSYTAAIGSVGGCCSVGGKEIFTLHELQNSSPSSVNPAAKELHLSDAEFFSIFGLHKAAWDSLPQWKKIQKKKQHSLF